MDIEERVGGDAYAPGVDESGGGDVATAALRGSRGCGRVRAPMCARADWCAPCGAAALVLGFCA